MRINNGAFSMVYSLINRAYRVDVFMFGEVITPRKETDYTPVHHLLAVT